MGMITSTHAFDCFARQVLPLPLDDRIRRDFQGLSRLSSLPREGVLDFSGDGEQILYLVQGATKLVAHASRSRDQVVAFHFSGDIFAVPEADNYYYSVQAMRPSDLLSFPGKAFLDIAATEAEVLRKLLDSTTLSLQRCREKAIALGRKTAAERIAVFLLGMGERIGREGDGRVTIDLPMSRREISESLGLTIETVSRQLSQLKQDGLIETLGRSGVVLRDRAALRCRAGFLSPPTGFLLQN